MMTQKERRLDSDYCVACTKWKGYACILTLYMARDGDGTISRSSAPTMMFQATISHVSVTSIEQRILWGARNMFTYRNGQQ